MVFQKGRVLAQDAVETDVYRALRNRIGLFESVVGRLQPILGCLRCLLLVMCTHPFAKEALTLHLARSEGHERYFGCNLMYPKVLALSHQHLMAEAPKMAAKARWQKK